MTSHTLHLIKTQTKYELLKLLRMPAYVITLIGLPLFFYSVTLTNSKLPEFTEGYISIQYLVCTFGTFGVFGIALFGFGVNFSIERAQGWYHTLLPTPIPIWLIFLAKLLACLVLVSFAILLLFLEAYLLYDIQLTWTSWLGIFFSLLIGALPLSTLGLCIGAFSGSNSVSIITMMVYLSIGSLSGLLATLSMLRAGNPMIAELAVIYPTYHVFQLALLFLNDTMQWVDFLKQLGFLLGYTFLFGSLALLGFKRHLNKRHG